MANSKVTALAAKATPVAADTLYLIDSADTTSKKATVETVLANPTVTMSNKTLDNSTTINIKDSNLLLQDNAGATKQARFECSGISAGQTRVLTVPDYDGTIATLAGTETLAAKTLTAPKIANGGFIADANGNEEIKFVTTAAAINELSVTNAAAGTSPILSATGDGADIGITLLGKGNGLVTVDNGVTTATAVGGAATLHKQRGVITSEALVTAANATYTLTITNSKVAADSIILASVFNGTNNQGQLSLVSAAPGIGSTVIVVKNVHASQAFNGTIKISFLVL